MLRKLTIQQHGRSSRPGSPRVGCLLLAVAGALAACTGGTDEPVEPAPPLAETDPEQPDAAPEPDPASDPIPGDADALEETWAAFQAAWAEQAAEGEPDPGAFEGLTVDPDATIELLDALRAGGRLVTTEQELWPRFEIDGDRAEVVDCVIAAQHPAGQPDSLATVTISWDATAVVTDDGWRIDSAQPGELFCIAQDLNDQLLAAYSPWHDGQREWHQPPDPEHPLLTAIMAEPGLSDMRAVLAEDRSTGISMRFPHNPEAVVTDLGFGSARITDCYVAPDGYGAFDVGSGERRADVVPAPEPGQLNRTVADLEATADGWFIVGWRWEERNSCEPGETRYVPR